MIEIIELMGERVNLQIQYEKFKINKKEFGYYVEPETLYNKIENLDLLI